MRQVTPRPPPRRNVSLSLRWRNVTEKRNAPLTSQCAPAWDDRSWNCPIRIGAKQLTMAPGLPGPLRIPEVWNGAMVPPVRRPSVRSTTCSEPGSFQRQTVQSPGWWQREMNSLARRSITVPRTSAMPVPIPSTRAALQRY